MPIPDYQTLMLPLMQHVADGQIHGFADVADALAQKFHLTESELRQLLPSGRYPTFRSRVGWARTYLAKAGLLAAPKRGQFKITPAGKTALAEKPPRIDGKFLRRYPSFVAFQSLKHDENPNSTTAALTESKESPEELIESAHAELKRALAVDLLSKIRVAAPVFFEKLVVELLLKMGYGGSRQDAGRAIGRSGDGGIDGIINEDRLGLDSIYLQAKRWENPVAALRFKNSRVHWPNTAPRRECSSRLRLSRKMPSRPPRSMTLASSSLTVNDSRR